MLTSTDAQQSIRSQEGSYSQFLICYLKDNNYNFMVFEVMKDQAWLIMKNSTMEKIRNWLIKEYYFLFFDRASTIFKLVLLDHTSL